MVIFYILMLFLMLVIPQKHIKLPAGYNVPGLARNRMGRRRFRCSSWFMILIVGKWNNIIFRMSLLKIDSELLLFIEIFILQEQKIVPDVKDIFVILGVLNILTLKEINLDSDHKNNFHSI